ncbi:unnamed protein product [Ectocarpus sp. 13 AM-2016]
MRRRQSFPEPVHARRLAMNPRAGRSSSFLVAAPAAPAPAPAAAANPVPFQRSCGPSQAVGGGYRVTLTHRTPIPPPAAGTTAGLLLVGATAHHEVVGRPTRNISS